MRILTISEIGRNSKLLDCRCFWQKMRHKMSQNSESCLPEVLKLHFWNTPRDRNVWFQWFYSIIRKKQETKYWANNLNIGNWAYIIVSRYSFLDVFFAKFPIIIKHVECCLKSQFSWSLGHVFVNMLSLDRLKISSKIVLILTLRKNWIFAIFQEVKFYEYIV